MIAYTWSNTHKMNKVLRGIKLWSLASPTGYLLSCLYLVYYHIYISSKTIFSLSEVSDSLYSAAHVGKNSCFSWAKVMFSGTSKTCINAFKMSNKPQSHKIPSLNKYWLFHVVLVHKLWFDKPLVFWNTVYLLISLFLHNKWRLKLNKKAQKIIIPVEYKLSFTIMILWNPEETVMS